MSTAPFPADLPTTAALPRNTVPTTTGHLDPPPTGTDPTMGHDAPAIASDADYTPASAGSLRQLRAEMLSRAAVIGTRARSAQIRGDIQQARALHAKAERLVQIARSVKVR